MKGFVYFLEYRPENLVKIGSSIGPEERLRAYQSWSPVPLELIATIPGDAKLERNIHNCFADLHSHSEWFFRSGRLDRAIKAIVSGVPVHEAIDLTDIRGNVLGNIQRATMARNGTRPGWVRRKENIASRRSHKERAET